MLRNLTILSARKTVLLAAFFLISCLSELFAQTIWIPPQTASWQWQLTGKVKTSYDVEVYDIDMFENDEVVVDSLHSLGRNVICYISAGSWEQWRPDARDFPLSVIGKPLEGWPGERWLDIRQIDILRPIMTARLDLCKDKGFDAVEPDNIDGYLSDTGFPLTYEDQLNYNIFLAHEAHARGLSIGLKNDLDQIPDLVHLFDWALNEQCFQFNECHKLMPFIEAGKAVFHVEYRLPMKKFCSLANELNFNSLKKRRNLKAWQKSCR